MTQNVLVRIPARVIPMMIIGYYISHCAQEVSKKKVEIFATGIFATAAALGAWGTSCLFEYETMGNWCGDDPIPNAAVLNILSGMVLATGVYTLNVKYHCC